MHTMGYNDLLAGAPAAVHRYEHEQSLGPALATSGKWQQEYRSARAISVASDLKKRRVATDGNWTDDV